MKKYLMFVSYVWIKFKAHLQTYDNTTNVNNIVFDTCGWDPVST